MTAAGMTLPSGSDQALALRDLAIEIGTEAARLVRTLATGTVSVSATKSSPVDVVTEVDRACEELVRARLLAARPQDAVLGEEEGDTEGTSGVRWIVDPVDGTVNLLYGIGEYAVSLAAEVDGEVVAGVVVDVAKDVLYAAALGHGATRDGVPLRVRPSPPVPERLLLTGFGYRPEVRAHQGACVARLLPRVRDIRRMGSCALDLCHVAEGTADGYVEDGPRPWDWAAGSLVVTEAGGRFAVLAGAPAPHRLTSEDSVLVASPAQGWDDLVVLLRQTGFLA